MTDFSAYTSLQDPAASVVGPQSLITSALNNPVAGAFNSLLDQRAPIVARGVSTQKSFDSKYTTPDPTLASAFQSASPDAIATLRSLDQHRVSLGQQPFSSADSAAMLRAADTRTLTTNPPERSLLSLPANALHDITNIATSLPKTLLQGIPRELLSIPQMPGAIADAMSGNSRNPDGTVTHTNPITALSRAPGLRLIPGAYTLGNLAEGTTGLRELITHPVMTGLDILPGASKLAEGTRVAELAAEAAQARMEAGGDVSAAIHPRPLSAVLTGKVVPGLDELGNPIDTLGRSRLGEAIDNLGQTRVGQLAKTAFGADARAITSKANEINQGLSISLNPEESILQKFAGDPAALREATVVRDSSKLADEYSHWTPEKVQSTTNLMEAGDFSSMDGEQLAYSSAYRDLQARYADIALAHDMGRIMDGELIPKAQADAVVAGRIKSQSFSDLTARRGNIESPTRDIPTILADAQDIASRPTVTGVRSKADLADQAAEYQSGALTPASKQLHLRALIHELDASGADTTGLMDLFHERPSRTDFSAINDRLTDLTVNGHIPRPNIPAQEMIDTLRTRSRTDGKLAVFVKALDSGDFALAKRTAADISRRTTYTIPELDGYIDSVSRARTRQAFLDSSNGLGKYTEANSARVTKALSSVEAQATPARFIPTIMNRVKQELISLHAGAAATDAARAVIVDDIMNGRYANVPGLDPATIPRLTRDIAATWPELRAQGIDPIFVHHVGLSQARELVTPHAYELTRAMSQFQARTLDVKPYIRDGSIAIKHQGLELLARRGSEEFAQFIADMGVDRDTAISRVLPRAMHMAERDPRIPLDEWTDRLLKTEYKQFNPRESGYTWSSDRLDKIADEARLIPRHIADVVDQLHNPRDFTFSAVTDPLMRTFRMSVLPLSPRFIAHQIFGSGMALLLRTDPGILKFAAQAREMLESGTLPDEMRAMLAGPRREAAELDYLSSRTASRWAVAT